MVSDLEGYSVAFFLKDGTTTVYFPDIEDCYSGTKEEAFLVATFNHFATDGRWAENGIWYTGCAGGTCYFLEGTRRGLYRSERGEGVSSQKEQAYRERIMSL